jgi:hypothetical protein
MAALQRDFCCVGVAAAILLLLIAAPLLFPHRQLQPIISFNRLCCRWRRRCCCRRCGSGIRGLRRRLGPPLLLLLLLLRLLLGLLLLRRWRRGRRQKLIQALKQPGCELLGVDCTQEFNQVPPQLRLLRLVSQHHNHILQEGGGREDARGEAEECERPAARGSGGQLRRVTCARLKSL